MRDAAQQTTRGDLRQPSSLHGVQPFVHRLSSGQGRHRNHVRLPPQHCQQAIGGRGELFGSPNQPQQVQTSQLPPPATANAGTGQPSQNSGPAGQPHSPAQQQHRRHRQPSQHPSLSPQPGQQRQVQRQPHQENSRQPAQAQTAPAARVGSAAAAWQAVLQRGGGGGPSWARLTKRPGSSLYEQHQLPPPALREAQVLATRLYSAVDEEFLAEEEEVKALYARTATARLQETGVVLLDLTAKPDGQLLDSKVWRLSPAKGGKLPYHKFSQRRAVTLSTFKPTGLPDGGVGAGTGNGTGKFVPFNGTVLALDRNSLRIAINHKNDMDMRAIGAERLMWRIDEAILDVTVQRQRDAVLNLHRLQRHTVAESRLRQIILGSPQAKQLANDWNPWAREPGFQAAARKQLERHSELNYSQKVAVGKALLTTFTFWQGPPGTGKTRTLLAFIRILCAVSAQRNQDSLSGVGSIGSILATGGTNAAADNILEGLVRDSELRVVRVGQAANVREELRNFTLAALTEKTLEAQGAGELRRAAAHLKVQTAKFSDKDRLDADAVAKKLQAQISEMTASAEELVLDRAQVVVATCAGAGEGRLAGRMFSMLVIDEATQATEPTTLIPLVKGVECCILAGDPQQLPPTVKSAKAFENGLDQTLFARLAETAEEQEARLAAERDGQSYQSRGLEPLLLDTQYRMHPEIAAFPSWAFYGGRLKTGVPPAERPLPKGLRWPNPQVPVAFLPCEHGTDRSDTSSGGGAASYQNRAEAEMALDVTETLMGGGDIESVSILTPYAGQVRLLTQLARQRGDHFADVSISSVDAYQGREADVIVFSTVRCNQERTTGFLKDYRRLNVAITRPRRGLVVVGSDDTLSSDKMWRAWLGWVRNKRAVLPLSALSPSHDKEDGF